MNFNNIFNTWYYYLLIIMLSILGYFVFFKKKKYQDVNTDIFKKIKKETKDQSVNVEDLITSIHKSKQLYSELAKKYHPDRYVDSESYDKILELFKEITKNKRNYKASLWFFLFYTNTSLF